MRYQDLTREELLSYREHIAGLPPEAHFYMCFQMLKGAFRVVSRGRKKSDAEARTILRRATMELKYDERSFQMASANQRFWND